MKEKLPYEKLLIENELLRQCIDDLASRVEELEKQRGKTSANENLC